MPEAILPLPILYQDDVLVAVHKPTGLLVHRTALDRGASEFALQRVRDQLGRHVYPVHRLDRATSGVLLFAFASAAARELTRQFTEQMVSKEYWAVVRGTPPEDVLVDHALREEDTVVKPPQTAKTHVARLATFEFPVQVDKYPTSRYALVRARPVTGRRHQVRRHLRHLGHPIIGDVTHGSGKHNRFWAERFGTRRMLLASRSLRVQHPETALPLTIQAPLAEDFLKIVRALGWPEDLCL